MRETKAPHKNESEGHSPIEKKRKVSLTEAIYDSPSRVYLTVHALKELDLRNFQERRHSPANNAIAVDFELRNSGMGSAHLKIFAGNGGLDLHDIREYQKPRIKQAIETINPRSHHVSDKEASTNTKSSLKSSVYDANFKEKCYNCGIYGWSYTCSSERPCPKVGNLKER